MPIAGFPAHNHHMRQIQKFKLYHYPATRSARVKWMLHEVLGDKFEVERIALYDGEQYEPTYMEKNPNHAVPTLELTLADGQVMHMIESAAMVTLLADAFPEKKLAPPANPLTAERANFLQMLHYGSTCIDMMLWQVRIHEHVLAADQRDPRTASRYRHKFATEAEPLLLTKLTRHHYICGDEFSAADCIVGHSVLWARLYGMAHDPAFTAYTERLMSRPAFVQAFSDLSDFTPEVAADNPLVQRFTG